MFRGGLLGQVQQMDFTNKFITPSQWEGVTILSD